MTAPGEGGLLLVDKPQGMTSHDVVARVRRALGTREVGHAGTLDPMATGVLVVCVGEATKLVAYLTGHDKRYAATVRLGVATHSLDADGEVVQTQEIPSDFSTRLPAVIDAERARTSQAPPVVSAIKVQGRAAHARTRAGEVVELAERSVVVHSLEVRAVRADEIDLEIACGKGYYVRSLGRDLAAGLGTVGHLVALRRVASGGFDVGRCVALDGDLRAALIPLRVAVREVLPSVELTEEGVLRARQGKPLLGEHFRTPPGEGACCWVDVSAAPVALGENRGGEHRVLRGFRPPVLARADLPSVD